MRVLFLTLYPEAAASPRYRVHQFLPHLRAQGFDCTAAPAVTRRIWSRHSGPNRRGRAFWYHAHETPRRLAQLLGARRYDVIVLQKALMSAYLRGMPALLRAVGDRLVYDMDDAVHLAPPHPLRGLWRHFEDRDQVTALMRAARVTLAGNAWLAEEVANAGGHAERFPTVVDTERFTPAVQPDSAFRLGWIGAPSTTPDLAAAVEALAGAADTAVRLVGADPDTVHWPEAEVLPWSQDREVEWVQSFSAGLMPLRKTDWTKGKCALKALLYMACGVPCIATPWGAVRDIIVDGENGVFADSPEEWRTAVDRLRDPGYRQSLGEAARYTVEARFSLHKAAPGLASLLEAVR